MTELTASSTPLSTLSTQPDGVDILLNTKEAAHYLRTKHLPEDFVFRLQAFVRFSVCQVCDDTGRDEETELGLCEACCTHDGRSAFTRHYRREPNESDPRIVFDPSDSWCREDPLTLNEALWYLETGELPHDFTTEVELVAQYGTPPNHQNPRVRGRRLR